MAVRRRKPRVSKSEKHNRMIDSQLHYLALQWIHAKSDKERQELWERQEKLKKQYR